MMLKKGLNTAEETNRGKGPSCLYPFLQPRINTFRVSNTLEPAFDEEGVPGASGKIASELSNGFTYPSGQSNEKRIQYPTQSKYRWHTGDESNNRSGSQKTDNENPKVPIVLKVSYPVSKEHKGCHDAANKQESQGNQIPSRFGKLSLILFLGTVFIHLQ